LIANTEQNERANNTKQNEAEQ